MEHISEIIIGFGYLGVFGAIFAESGIFLGAFLPGDSLLFTVGLLASQGYFNIWVLLPLAALFAILGDNFGYYFGHTMGPKIFSKEDSFFFRKSHVKKTKEFYDRYGKKTIIIARFVPIIRTFAPILAGVANMEYRTFFFYNVVGGVFWTASMLLAGYTLGSLIPGLERHLEPIVLGIIALSVSPIIYEWWRSRKIGAQK